MGTEDLFKKCLGATNRKRHSTLRRRLESVLVQELGGTSHVFRIGQVILDGVTGERAGELSGADAVLGAAERDGDTQFILWGGYLATPNGNGFVLYGFH